MQNPDTHRVQTDEALRESDADLRDAQRLAHIGSWRWDPATDTVTWSEELYRINGRDPRFPAPSYAELSSCYTPESWTRLSAAVGRALASGTPYELDLDMVRPDGTTRVTFAKGEVTRDAAGSIVGLHGIVQDITELRKAQSDIARALSLLESTMESTADGILVVDGKGGITRYNARFKQIWGIPDSIAASKDDNAALGFVLDQLKDPGAFITTVRALYDSPEAVSFDTLEFKDGRVIERYSQPQRIGDEVVGRVWSFRDVTERTRAELSLREREEQLSLVLEGSQLGFWDWDIETGIVRRNRRWAEMLGYTLEEIKVSFGQSAELHHPDDRAATWQSIQDHLDGRTPMHRAEYRMLAKDGHYRWILDRARVVKRSADGKPLRMTGTHTDITDRKLAEQERARLESQLLQAQKMESVGRLAGGVAHDFNNMLGVIIGHADFALELASPSSPLHADLMEIRNAARRSADLVRQLLAFARRQTVEPRVTNLNVIVSNTIKMLERMIGEEIELRWKPESALWPVHVDPSQVDQILTNLCVNARDAISGVGVITIETGNESLTGSDCVDLPPLAPGDYVRLTISDNGAGIDEETLGKIFEPFFTTKDFGAGIGLGLATVYGAVQQANGAIKVTSKLGFGSTFAIYIPRHTGTTEPAPRGGTKDAVLRGDETILLVEDEPAILSLARTMLERQGYAVLAASRPGQALKMAMDHVGRIHLLITDVVMPEMNGRSLARTLSSLHPDMKRLFISGYAADVIEQGGGLDDSLNFLQKPFTIEGLASKVREVLDRTALGSERSTGE